MSSEEETIRTITRIWEEVFSKEPISPNANFKELGGDASMVVEIVFQLEIAFEMDLPVEVFIMLPTIEEMAFAVTLLKHKQVVASKYLTTQELIKLQMTTASMGNLVKKDSLMIIMNEEGKLPPLFWCFNSPAQEILPLAKRLSKNQPLYALTSSVTLGRAPEIMDRLTSHYVDEILERYPDAPIHLGGNCRGARVICEIMFKLQERGKTVDKLCLLESFNPKLFDYTGKLVLLFGTYSELKRHELIHWGEKNWEKRFQKVPSVFFIPCEHGQFFTDKNIGALSKRVNNFLGKKSFFRSLFQN